MYDLPQTERWVFFFFPIAFVKKTRAWLQESSDPTRLLAAATIKMKAQRENRRARTIDCWLSSKNGTGLHKMDFVHVHFFRLRG